MPNNWKKYKFSDFVEINPTIRFPKDELYSFVEMKDLNENNKFTLPSTEKAVTGGARFEENDTLFARITPCLQNGKICQVKGLKNNVGFGSTEFLVFRGKKEISDTDFVYYLSREEGVRKFAEQNMIGTSGRQRVVKDAFQNLILELPPLPEQQAIAEILSSLDDKIELNLQMNKTLEEMANALYKHWFVDFGPFQNGKFIESELGLIPEGWSIGVLSDITNFYNGYGFKSGDLLDDNIGDCYHVFKMGHIKKGGGLKSDGTRSYVQKSKCNKLENFVLKKGDLLMSMTDMKDKVTILGHTAIMDEDDKYIVNQRVGLIRAKIEYRIGYPYLYILTNSIPFLSDLRSRANSGVQVNLSTEGIKSTKVLIAPKDINEDFNSTVVTFYEKIFENAKENENLKQTRDYLLPKLVSGEIRVKDAAKKVKEVL
jgi:type I restriction enzyme S subunit